VSSHKMPSSQSQAPRTSARTSAVQTVVRGGAEKPRKAHCRTSREGPQRERQREEEDKGRRETGGRGKTGGRGHARQESSRAAEPVPTRPQRVNRSIPSSLRVHRETGAAAKASVGVGGCGGSEDGCSARRSVTHDPAQLPQDARQLFWQSAASERWAGKTFPGGGRVGGVALHEVHGRVGLFAPQPPALDHTHTPAVREESKEDMACAHGTPKEINDTNIGPEQLDEGEVDTPLVVQAVQKVGEEGIGFVAVDGLAGCDVHKHTHTHRHTNAQTHTHTHSGCVAVDGLAGFEEVSCTNTLDEESNSTDSVQSTPAAELFSKLDLSEIEVCVCVCSCVCVCV